MAERIQRKFADAPSHGESDFQPSDPFAELTRIMGFDPRVASLGAQRPAAGAPGDGFDIDLESELTGALAASGDEFRQNWTYGTAPANDAAYPQGNEASDLSIEDELAMLLAGDANAPAEQVSHHHESAGRDWQMEAQAENAGDAWSAEAHAPAYESEIEPQPAAAQSDVSFVAPGEDDPFAALAAMAASPVAEPARARSLATPSLARSQPQPVPAPQAMPASAPRAEPARAPVVTDGRAAAAYREALAAAMSRGTQRTPDPVQMATMPAPHYAEQRYAEPSYVEPHHNELEAAALYEEAYPEVAEAAPAQAVSIDEWRAASAQRSPATFEHEDGPAELPQEQIAVADDLYIPDLELHQEQPAAAQRYDDLDLDLDDLRFDPPVQAVSAAPAHAYAAAQQADEFDAAFARDTEAHHGHEAAYDSDLRRFDAAPVAAHAWAGHTDAQAASVPAYQQMEPSYEDYAENDLAFEDENRGSPAYVPQRRAPRRIALYAGLLAGVAVLGAGAVIFLTGNGSGTGAPVLVRADPEPVKVRPANPGGTSVPNQDNPTYNRVAGAANASPTQETLLSASEEPVDMTPPIAEAPEMVAPEDGMPSLEGEENPEMAAEAGEGMEALPGVGLPPESESLAADDAEGAETVGSVPAGASGKNEDRIAAAIAGAEPSARDAEIAIAPRKVRTMVVRPDGTLAPREEPVRTEPVAAPAVETPAPAVAAKAEKVVPQPAAVATTGGATPKSVPIAPSRPADQPVEIVGGVTEQRVASIEPQAGTAAAQGGWTMQIASQPTAEAAQSNYEALARRFGGVIGDKGVNIVKAEVPGKGTFYRVRVPAGSRNDAISLCEKYKGAGGSCFVSR